MTHRFLGLICSFLITTAILSDKNEDDLVLSTPDQISTLHSSFSSLIGGVISPLSGAPYLRQTDLVVQGAEPLTLNRVYISHYMPTYFEHRKKHTKAEWDKYFFYEHLNKNYQGWQFLPHLRLQTFPRLMEFHVTDSHGATLKFHLSSDQTTLVSPPFAISNNSGEIPSGKYDPRNTRINLEDNGIKIRIYDPDGTIRLYQRTGGRRSPVVTNFYLLEKETLPNGRVLKYHYNASHQLTRVESLDPKERHVYASIHIEGVPENRHCHFISSTGATADYHYNVYDVHIKPKDNNRSTATYSFSSLPRLTSASSPFFRHETSEHTDHFLISSYSGQNDVYAFKYTPISQGGIPHFRVESLQLPVGPNDALYNLYHMEYSPPIAGEKEGRTIAKNSDGSYTAYHFCKNLLSKAICHYGIDGALKKETLFFWEENHWLKAIEVLDGQKNLLYRRSYEEYDRFGNPLLELFTGDLTGKGNRESFAVKRVFSEDGRNLLLKEENEDGRTLCFSYLLNTNLVTSKLTQDGEKIILREFFIYDDCHNLIQTIADDGSATEKEDLSHVTQRTLTTHILRKSAPFLHMPDWTEETYWENGKEKLLKKNQLTYDQQGNLAQEAVYDAEGTQAYTLHKTYNERGDLLSETNRLGQTAFYTYDAKGQRETATNFSQRLHTTFQYDTRGRLKKQTEKGDDGIVHVGTAEYDVQGRKIKQKDPFQNVTNYAYDPLVNQVIKTDFPPITSIDGKAVAVSTCSTYDPLGRVLSKTDANGNTTTYRYNAYGDPIEIRYPNESKESFRYTKNGLLASHIDQDGLVTHFTYDVLERVLSKNYISKEGELLAEETFTYNGFNLLSKTDKEGNLTCYSYDGVGRKTREEFCGRATEFIYDSLGWLSTTCKGNGDNSLLIHYKRDLEGQVIEEWKTDSAGHTLYKIAYSYDADGNRETTTRSINGKDAVDTFGYDSFCRVIKHQDAEGYLTQTTYSESCTNALGQRVLQTATLDPLHITTLKTQDALARTMSLEILNAQGKTISCQEMTHDPQGNLLYKKDHVYEKDRFQNTQTIQYTYTSNNQIENLTRGLGTQEERTTTYTYFPSGKMEAKTLPDGVTLSYNYHPLGFMSRVDSSDGVIHHSFEYNRLGHLRYALDEKNDQSIKRNLDPFGNIVREVFPSGLEIKKEYDCFNQPLSLTMANEGTIFYTYDPLFLREVKRTSSSGRSIYTHAYESYDLDGNLVSESLIGSLGQTNHVTDIKGQKAYISSPYFSQECEYNAVGNLITNVVDREKYRYSYDEHSQLSSENSPTQSTTYTHDSLYNRVQKNEKAHELNNLNELLSSDSAQYSYDLNGNQISQKALSKTSRFAYDPLNQLVEATSDGKKLKFIYDPLGRRLSKTIYELTSKGWQEISCEYYLYDGQNELGAFTPSHEPKNLRVLGLAQYKDNPATVGIEIEGQVLAPLMDVQGNIRRLISLETQTIASSYDFTAFGEELQKSLSPALFNPWRFASKRLDQEIGTLYFGRRYYDPRFGRWLTTDPAGFIDSTNLYQYVFNNPFRYKDPDGQFVMVIPLGVMAWKLIAAAVITAYVTYEIEQQHRHSDSALARSFNSAVHQVVQTVGGVSQYALNQKDISFEKRSSRPNPDHAAEGNPHTIIQIPGATGSYTTHNGDGTYKQYRGSGKPHGNIARPNVKEIKNNPSPTGPKPGKPEVRKPTTDEIPQSK